MVEKRMLVIPVIFATLLLLPCVYAGSYFMLMYPVPHLVVTDTTVQIGKSAAYIGNAEWIETAYAPMHHIDCQIRPDLWAFGDPKEVPADYDNEHDFLGLDEHGRLIVHKFMREEPPPK